MPKRQVISCYTGPQSPLLDLSEEDFPPLDSKQYLKKIHHIVQELAIDVSYLKEKSRRNETAVDTVVSTHLSLEHRISQLEKTVHEIQEVLMGSVEAQLTSQDKAIETLGDQVNLIFVAQGANPPNLSEKN